MKVNFGQFVLETDEMTAFATGVDSMPVIYVTQHGTAFLKLQRPHWLAPKIRRLDRAEALRLADSCHLPLLKERLTRPKEISTTCVFTLPDDSTATIGGPHPLMGINETEES